MSSIHRAKRKRSVILFDTQIIFNFCSLFREALNLNQEELDGAQSVGRCASRAILSFNRIVFPYFLVLPAKHSYWPCTDLAAGAIDPFIDASLITVIKIQMRRLDVFTQ